MGLALTVVTAVAIGLTADWSYVGKTLEGLRAQPLLLVLAASGFTLAFVLRAQAWHHLLNAPARVDVLFRALQAGLLLNHLLPLKAGEAARVIFVTRRGVAPSDAIASTLIARLLDVAALLTLSLIAFALLGPEVIPNAPLMVAVIVVGLTGTVLVLTRTWVGALGWLPTFLRNRLQALQTSLQAIEPSQIAAAALWTLPSWAIEACVLLAAAEAAGADISVTTAVAATAFTILFQAVHLTPGGIGVYEASMASVLHASGMPPTDAVALATVTHGLKFGYAFTLGFGFTAWECWRARQASA